MSKRGRSDIWEHMTVDCGRLFYFNV